VNSWRRIDAPHGQWLAIVHGSPHGGFDFETDPHGTETRVLVRGSLDSMIAPILERSLENLDLATVSRVVLDLRHLESIDADGVRLVLALRGRCLKHRRELKITSGSAPRWPPRTLRDIQSRAGRHDENRSIADKSPSRNLAVRSPADVWPRPVDASGKPH
jgi:anti-anti-sigma factor